MKIAGRHLYIVLAAAAGRVGGGGEAHQGVDRRGLKKFVGFVKVKAKGGK